MRRLLSFLSLIFFCSTAFAEVQYKTNDTPNTTSTIGTMPVYLNNGVVTAVSSSNPLPVNASVSLPAGGSTLAAQATGNTSLASIDGKITAVNTGAVTQATGSTIKIADRDGDVITSQNIGQSVALDVNLRSGTPTTIAVTNTGTFATQDTPATGATVKLANREGNVFTSISTGNTVALDVNLRYGTPSTTNVIAINGLSPAMGVGTATAGTLQVVIATPSTVRMFDSTGNTISSNAIGALNVNIASPATVSSRVLDGVGNSITSGVAGALNIYVATPSSIRLLDSTGNTINSTGSGALRVQSATGSVVQTIVGVDMGWTTATQSTLNSVVQTVKSTKGNFGGYFFYNSNSSAAYLQVFDATGPATSTLTTLKMIIGLPATAGANMEWSNGISFSNGICIRAATTATGNTAVSNGVEGFVAYK